MKLVIGEKPSVSRALSAVLGAKTKKDGYVEGNGYIVSWCFGHLVGLRFPNEYNEKWAARWSFSQLPMIPDKWQFKTSDSGKAQFDVLRDLMNDARVDEIICATDAGREGELIFRLVYNEIRCNKPFSRLWISSMGDSAIRDGFNNLRPGYDFDNLYNAAVARSEADWLVGINATRLFTTLYSRKLTVGRVQTPTLAMLVDRSDQIKNFVKQKYFNVHLELDDFDAVKEKIFDEDEADRIVDKCNGQNAVITSVTNNRKTVNPPKLYDLTTLQREANRFLGMLSKTRLLHQKGNSWCEDQII